MARKDIKIREIAYHRNGVKLAWLIRRSVERMVEQANGGALLPLDFGQGENHHA